MPFFLAMDTTVLLVIPAMLFALYAQSKVRSTYARFSRVPSFRGLRGADVARTLLDRAGLHGVRVEMAPGPSPITTIPGRR